jgi:hypothetical protein
VRHSHFCSAVFTDITVGHLHDDVVEKIRDFKYDEIKI